MISFLLGLVSLVFVAVRLKWDNCCTVLLIDLTASFDDSFAFQFVIGLMISAQWIDLPAFVSIEED
jgi:hypothetical protein